MIDPLHEDLLSRIGAPGRGFLLWIRGVISPCGIDRISGAIFRGRRAVDRVWGRSSYQSGTTIFAKLQESLVADSLTKRDVVSSRAIQDKDTPLVVISSGDMIRKDTDWEDKVCEPAVSFQHWIWLTDIITWNSNAILAISPGICKIGTLWMVLLIAFGIR
jgi:hypothetical protein